MPLPTRRGAASVGGHAPRRTRHTPSVPALSQPRGQDISITRSTSRYPRGGRLVALFPEELRDRGLREPPLGGELALGDRLLLTPGVPDPVRQGRRDVQRPPALRHARGAQIGRLRGLGPLLLEVHPVAARWQPTRHRDVVATLRASAMMQDPRDAMRVRFLVAEERAHHDAVALESMEMLGINAQLR